MTKISVPEFSGEDDKDGMVTRGYLRKVAALEKDDKVEAKQTGVGLVQQPHRQGMEGC